MKKLFCISVLLCLLIGLATGQSKIANTEPAVIPIEVTFFNNGNFLPGNGALGIWSRTFHPGISIGTRFYYKSTSSYQLFQTAKLGYFYHRHSQHGIQAYSELGYRKYFGNAFYVEPRLGVGYMLSIPALEIYTFQNGIYEAQQWKGRSQIMGGLTIALGYNLEKISGIPIDGFLGYQFWVQSPFVNKYVPILPNNSVQLGLIYYFTQHAK